MELYSSNDSYKLYKGNMLDMLEVISPNSIDSIITDPPYELNFMNRSWDNSGIAFNKDAWKKCFDVIKPGGYLLAFGGSRTFHRIAVAIEDAGFEIKDTIMYLYGSGFPKGLNIGYAVDKKNGIDNRTGNMRDDGKATVGEIYEWANGRPDTKIYEERVAQNEWSGWNTQLKPSYEPVIVAQKPIEKSIVDNVLKYRVGALNIDECRVPAKEGEYDIRHYTKEDCFQNLKPKQSKFQVKPQPDGRYPANVIHDGSDEAISGFPDSKSNGSDYDFESSNQDNTTHLYTNIKSGRHFEDEGSCARYFYCAKASRFDRDEGLDDLESKRKYVDNGTRKPEGKSIMEGSNVVAKNIHPTCKPTDLMRYLVRLVSPKGATILDCFNGSGSTGKAVMLENKQYNKNYKYIGIELTEEYLPIAKARIEYICNNEFDFWKDENGKEQRQVKDKDVMTIFDFTD